MAHATVQKMAVLLQSLDSDGDLTTGIDINSTTRTNFALTGNLADKTDNEISTEITARGKTVKDKIQALTHLLTSTKAIASSTKIDLVPDAFSFTDLTGQALSSVVESAPITVAGIDIASPISVSGGYYKIGSGAWTNQPSKVTNGQTVTLKGTASSDYATVTDVTLTIGGVSDTFSIATIGDTIPTAFSFTDVTNVALSTLTESNEITVAGLGIGVSATISVTGGEYSINGGAYTAIAGTVSNGQTVKVKHTSSASNATATNTTLTIGGLSDTFRTTTLIPNIYEPLSGATNVGPYTWVKMNFGEDINSTDINVSNFSGATFSTCDYNSSTKSAICKLVNGAKFADNTTYTITAPVRALGGYDKNVSISFTTGKVNIFPLLRTGQSTSYANYDDGWYATNNQPITNQPLGIARSFTRDNDKNITTDTVTLLQWQDDTTVTSNEQNWTNAVSYCDNLTLGGYADWRLPTIEELMTIANKGEYNPAKFSTFSNMVADNYWSSKTSFTDSAWCVSFYNSHYHWRYKTYSSYVRCVRGGQ